VPCKEVVIKERVANKAGRYPSDVTDDEREFYEPYFTLMRGDELQRECPRREVYNALRYVVRSGCG
jgi:hypothetical protein